MKSFALVTALLASLLCISCRTEEKQATQPDATKPLKIAIISSRDILTRCDAGGQAVKDIQSKFSDRRITMGLLEQDIRKLQEEVKGSQVKGPKSNLLQDKLQAYAEEERKLRQDVGQEESARFKPIADVVNRVLEQYAKEHNVSAIQERGTFAYYDRSLDITDEIITWVNVTK